MRRCGQFEERGYTIQAYIPDNDAEPMAFEVRILIVDELKYTLLIPMAHPPVFGVDVDDGRSLDAMTNRIIELLPPANQFAAGTIAALDALELEFGRKAVRDAHGRRSSDPRRTIGPFEHTRGLFAQTFAALKGGREAMDRWMQTKQPALGDRTPAEALRLGMLQEVLKLLRSTDR